MGEIPEDVQRAALAAVDAMPSRPPWKADVRLAIEGAILAERQRCADLADKEADGYKSNGFPQAALGAITTRKAILG